MENNWKVEINDDWSTRNKNIFIFIRKPDGTDDIVNFSSEDRTVITMTNVKPGDSCNPTMVMREDMLQALFEAMSKKGMKSPEKGYMEGQLSMIERHLEDMRSLVFKKD